MRVVLCDDHEVVRDGLRLVLSGEPGIEVVGEAAGTADVFDVTHATRPDVLILDLTLGAHDGIPVLRELRTRFPGTSVVVLTMHRDPETVRQVLLAGADGFIVKGARSSDLIDAVRAVAHGDRYVHSSVAGVVVDDSVRWLRSGTGLSEREREILSLIGGGQTGPMIAERLGISVHTVHRHVANLSAKLDVHGLSSLVRYAVEHDYIRSSPPGAPASSGVAGDGRDDHPG